MWRDGPMNPPGSSIALISDHLAQLSRRKEGRDALTRFEVVGLDVRGAGDLAALMRQCAGSGARAGGRRDQILATLVPLSITDDLAALCGVIALRPELIRASRLLARGTLEVEEADAETVAIAWHVLTDKRRGATGSSRARALANAIWNEVRRSGGLARGSAVECAALPEDFDVAAPEEDLLESCPGLLAAAVAEGELSAEAARIIVRSRVNDEPLTEIAKSLGRRYEAVKHQRRRAESALRDFAPRYYSSESR
jgi:DNA-directed RNA polymerase specialized sigma24 family protein